MTYLEIIRIVLSALIIFFSSWLVGSIGVYWRTRIYDKNLKVLKPPFSIFWIGLVGFIGCVVTILIIFFVAFNEVNAALSIGFLLMSFLGVWLMLYAINWKIEIKEESFIYRNMFGKKREIKFIEITKLKRIKIGGYRIYIGKKSIAVDYFIKGADNLWEILKVLKLNG